MAYGRDDRDTREQRSRFEEQRGGRGPRDSGSDRGFFDRSRDEISSWFGDDEAERRREMDERGGGGGRGEPRDEDRRPYAPHDDRDPRYCDEGLRRPYTGRMPERASSGRYSPDMDREQAPSYRAEQGSSYRPMTGDYGRSTEREPDSDRSFFSRAAAAVGVGAGATAAHDRHYGEWRQRQIDEIDRDYDDYRREHQSKFESDFSNWRSTRQSKRQMLGSIKEHMEVVGSDEQPVGKVDKVRGDRVILTKDDSPDSQYHSVNCAMIDRVEGDRVILDKSAADAKSAFGNEDRDRALYERDDQRGPGAHILNRSFSGTY